MTESNSSEDKPRVISHSEIALFQDCEWRHDFRYVQRLEPERPASGASIANTLSGSAVHFGLEQHLTAGRNAEHAAVEYAQARTLVMPEEAEAIKAATRAGLEFLKALGPVKIIAVERKFERTIGDWHTRGVIDFAYIDEFHIAHILDWKSSEDLPQDTTGQIDPQTTLYAFHIMEELGAQEIYAGRCYLRLMAPAIKLTQGGTINLKSVCSDADYRAWAFHHPRADRPEAAARFHPWYRHHEDLLTRDFCLRILKNHKHAAARIQDRRLPLIANWRVKLCVRCEYNGACQDRMVNEYNDGE